MEYKQFVDYEAPCAEAIELVMESSVNTTGDGGGGDHNLPDVPDEPGE